MGDAMTIADISSHSISMSYPFSAIVGQEDMKLALTIAAIEPKVGGVLVFGDRGTGKSTIVRALANLLPKMPTMSGCRFNCKPGSVSPECPDCIGASVQGEALRPVPVVDLPLGATEDRVVGALDLERALTCGEKVFEPGLLARAHRGFLYVDEVNLLEDHLIDLLLDVAASGENVVEREGLSIRHPASFVLVGSGNPEEGELRPQLLDRFGLCVEVTTPTDPKARVEIIRRRDAFDRDRKAFQAEWSVEEEWIRGQILTASARLNSITVPVEVMEQATNLCIMLGTDGLRGELVLIKAARALAALEQCDCVEHKHVRGVAALALQHRLRRSPLDESASATRVERCVVEIYGEEHSQREDA